MSPFVRHSHDHEGDLAVFLIGMRVNQPLRPDLYLPVFAAMPAMLSELYAAKAAAQRGAGADPGFLEAYTVLGLRGPLVVQYWRTVSDIYAYASDPDKHHRPAAAAFYRRSRAAASAVGIWHETFAVPAGGHESLYVGMPPTGLGKAYGTTTDLSRRRHARHVRAAAPTGDAA